MLWLIGIVFLEIDFKDDPLSTRGLIYLKQAYKRPRRQTPSS
jgi:hypothetical protein